MKRTYLAIAVATLFIATSFAPKASAHCGACAGDTEAKKHDKSHLSESTVGNQHGAHAAKLAAGLGDKAPNFSAARADTGQKTALSDVAGKKLTAVIFWNQTCPFVVNAKPRIQEFQKAFAKQGVKVVAVDAGTNNKPDAVTKYSKDLGFSLLVNRDSAIASQFGATKTPEVFLLDKDMVIRYHGAFDSGRPGKSDKVTPYLHQATKALLAGNQPDKATTKAFGCSVNYAKGVKPLPAATAKAPSMPERGKTASHRDS